MIQSVNLLHFFCDGVGGVGVAGGVGGIAAAAAAIVRAADAVNHTTVHFPTVSVQPFQQHAFQYHSCWHRF